MIELLNRASQALNTLVSSIDSRRDRDNVVALLRDIEVHLVRETLCKRSDQKNS